MSIRIPLARPNITQVEIDAVVEVLRTPHLSLGPKVPAFEESMARYCGTRHAVACSSGTAGLHLLVRAMGIGPGGAGLKGAAPPGDEVITTPFSFVASANCMLMEGARPVFVDIHPDHWDLDPSRIEAAITPRTKAILPVDVFGQIADMESIRIIAERHGLKIIEDSCEALGSEWGGRRAGSFGDAGVFGFYPNKQITTGEGGMIVTDDDRIADLCRSMRNQGRDTAVGGSTRAFPAAGAGTIRSESGVEGGLRRAEPAASGWLAHPRMGYNYRMSDINAALGLAQLSRIDEIKRHRRRVYKLYRERLSDNSRLRMQSVRASGIVSPASRGTGRGDSAGRPESIALTEIRGLQDVHWFVFVVRLSDDVPPTRRDEILRALAEQGIGCSNYFAPIHLQQFYMERFGHKPGDFPICESVAARTIALPFHHELTEGDVEEVCEALNRFL